MLLDFTQAVTGDFNRNPLITTLPSSSSGDSGGGGSSLRLHNHPHPNTQVSNYLNSTFCFSNVPNGHKLLSYTLFSTTIQFLIVITEN